LFFFALLLVCLTETGKEEISGKSPSVCLVYNCFHSVLYFNSPHSCYSLLLLIVVRDRCLLSVVCVSCLLSVSVVCCLCQLYAVCVSCLLFVPVVCCLCQLSAVCVSCLLSVSVVCCLCQLFVGFIRELIQTITSRLY